VAGKPDRKHPEFESSEFVTCKSLQVNLPILPTADPRTAFVTRTAFAAGVTCRRRGNADRSSEHVLGGRRSRLDGAEGQRPRTRSVLGAPAGTSSRRAPRRLGQLEAKATRGRSIRGDRRAASRGRVVLHRPGWPSRGAHPQRLPRGPRAGAAPGRMLHPVAATPASPESEDRRPQRRGHPVHEDRRPQRHGHPVHEDRRPQRRGRPVYAGLASMTPSFPSSRR
jgi:hypothetical protein